MTMEAKKEEKKKHKQNKKTRGQYKTIQLESLVTSHFC